jgi:hypothetical protein
VVIQTLVHFAKYGHTYTEKAAVVRYFQNHAVVTAGLLTQTMVALAERVATQKLNYHMAEALAL